MEEKQVLRELISVLMIWGSIVYVFVVGIIGLTRGNCMETLLKGIVVMAVAWTVIISTVIRKFL